MNIYWIIILLLVFGILGFIMFRLKYLYKQYLKIKLIESPDFDRRKYQSKNAETYYIKTTKILKEKDSNPKLIAIKSQYNYWIKVYWYSIIVALFLLLFGFIIEHL